MKLRKLTLTSVCTALLAAAASFSLGPGTTGAYEGEAYALKGGTVVTVTGDTIKNGVVVIRNGLIASVGADGAIPADARVIDAAGLTVYPGLFDSNSGYGIRPEQPPAAGRGAGGGDPTQMMLAQMLAPQSSAGLLPEVSVVDQLQITTDTFDAQRAAGITTALTAPRNGVFQGQSALINLGGETAEKLILKSPASLNVGFTSARGGYPNSLMGVFSFLRQSLMDAQYYRDEWARYNKNPRGAVRPQINKSLAALQPVINRELPVIFNVTSAREIRRAIALGEEFNLKFMLAGATQSYQTADYLKSKNVTVLLSLGFPQKPQGIEDPEDESLAVLRDRSAAPSAAAALAKAGVKFAFTSGTLLRPADYLANASRAVEAGLSKEEALKALTIYPAQIFGVSEQLGSIEKGKIANLIVTSGDLFEKNTKVRHIFVDGKYYEPKAPPPTPGGRGGGPVPRTTGSGAAVGTWKLSVVTPMGTREMTLALSQDGENVTGSIQMGPGAGSITNGRLAGTDLTIDLTLDFGGRSVPGKLTGRIEGDTFNGSLSVMGRDSQATGTREPK